MATNVVLIDDNPDTLRHLAEYLAPATTVVLNDQVVGCTFHPLRPVVSPDDPTTVDLDATLKKALESRPGVAVIDLKLEGDAADDYSGADLALRIKRARNDCCIILVSYHFEAAPRLLDNVEIFRFRVDRNREGFGEELRKRFEEAIRHHVSAVALRRLLNASEAPSKRVKTPASRAVYISYARDDEGCTGVRREEIVNRIEASLKTNGYDVRRDISHIGYTRPISAFMREVGRGGCIIAVLSEGYLRSPFCMYELLEIDRNRQFRERVCPVVLPDARVTRLEDRLTYVSYWSTQFDDLQDLFRKVTPAALAPEAVEELLRHRDIAQQAAKLLSYIADMNHLTPEALEKDDFAVLRNRMDQCLK